jgi:universal stress protein E
MNKLVLVVGEELDCESLELKKAKHIAASFKAEVEVLRFLPQTCSDTAKQSATQSIGELVHSVFKELTGVTSQIIPSNNISKWVAAHYTSSDDCLVLKTGHRSERLFHTPTDWELIRQLRCPLLISSNRKWKSQPNVLVALDSSSHKAEHRELNNLALRWAQQWQATSGSQLHALYSIPIPAPLLALDLVERRDYQRAHEPEAKEKLLALLEEFGATNMTPHILTGPPSKTIPHMANELKADLVIMGSVGREGIRGALRGNTAEKVLHHLRTDMLVVKTSAGSPAA